jgi:medium-chain acyl-[acyl-carrier-protein] hydrolase
MEGYVAHYPGRGSRYREPPIPRLSTLAERLCQAIQPLADKPFAFFGHSLGGCVAFEMTRLLRKDNLPQPILLFISACGAPHLTDPHPPIHALPDAEFLQALQELDGIPSELRDNAEIMQLLLPPLRADFEAFEEYRYDPDQPPLDIPIIVFGGLDDPRVSREYLEGWGVHTNASFKSQFFSGDHFFINSARELILTSIDTELASSHAKN